MNEKSQKNSALQRNVESSLLLKDLNSFNSELAIKQNHPRLYDIKSNTLIQHNSTRVNWRAFWVADAGGAYKGGRWGARFGSAFSPSGAIAGAVVGGLLCAAISSALEEWIDNGEMVQADEVYDAEEALGLFHKIPPSGLVAVQDEIKIKSLSIDSTFQAVGIAHNVLLDRILEEAVEAVEEENEISLTSFSIPIEEREEDNEPDIAVTEFDIFYNDEAAEVVTSEGYKENYFSHVNNRLNSKTDIDNDNSIGSHIMNLFYEASLLNGGTSNDIVSIANYYYDLISNSSELSDEDKYAVCIGMAVATYSAKYWEQK